MAFGDGRLALVERLALTSPGALTPSWSRPRRSAPPFSRRGGLVRNVCATTPPALPAAPNFGGTPQPPFSRAAGRRGAREREAGVLPDCAFGAGEGQRRRRNF